MTQLWKLSDKDFETVCHQRDDNNGVSKGQLEIRKTVTKLKNAFDELISRLDIAEEGISELEDMSTETAQTEKQRERKTKQNKPPKYIRTVGQF